MKCKRVKRDEVFIKFLGRKNRSLYASYKFPEKIKPGYVTPPVKTLVMCQSGWHFTSVRYLRNWINDRCYVVVPIKEYTGLNDTHYSKACSRRIRFIGELKPPKGFKTWIRWRNDSNGVDKTYDKSIKTTERRAKRLLANYRARNRK